MLEAYIDAGDADDFDDGGGVTLEEINRQNALVRAALKELTKDRPDLKRRRIERNALHQIRVEQRKTDLVFDRRVFGYLVREMLGDITNVASGIDDEAIAALQTEAESHLVELFRGANAIAVCSDRTMILPKHLWAARSLQN
jgi:histone H3/H4